MIYFLELIRPQLSIKCISTFQAFREYPHLEKEKSVHKSSFWWNWLWKFKVLTVTSIIDSNTKEYENIVFKFCTPPPYFSRFLKVKTYFFSLQQSIKSTSEEYSQSKLGIFLPCISNSSFLLLPITAISWFYIFT